MQYDMHNSTWDKGIHTWNIGASGSVLIATIVFESFIPARCCIAPEIPIPM